MLIFVENINIHHYFIEILSSLVCPVLNDLMFFLHQCQKWKCYESKDIGIFITDIYTLQW